MAAAGCGADSASTGDWAGTVYDSAGIPVIVNPATGHRPLDAGDGVATRG